MAAALERFDAAACGAACGVAAEDIDGLAERMTQGPAVLYGRMGVATQAHGTLNAWLIGLINIAAGQLDREGGIVFPLPALDTLAILPPGSIGKHRSRVSGHRSVAGGTAGRRDGGGEIETPGPGRLRALFVVAGNPVLSTPNGARLDKALSELDLMVSIDMYRNATSRRAHYILPPVGPLERDHYGLFLLPMAVRTIAAYSPPTLAPEDGTLQDWEILRGLGRRDHGRAGAGTHPARDARRLAALGALRRLAGRCGSGPIRAGFRSARGRAPARKAAHTAQDRGLRRSRMPGSAGRAGSAGNVRRARWRAAADRDAGICAPTTRGSPTAAA